MRKIVTIGFAAGLLAAALPAQAANSNSNSNSNSNTSRSEAPAREQPRADNGAAPQRQICVIEPRSESRIRRQVCHTAREWRDLQGDDVNGN